MNKTMSRLTVFFETPYWKAVFERESIEGYELVKVVFGAEPKDYEVYEYVRENYLDLNFKFTSLDKEEKFEKKISYKKLQKEIKKEVCKTGIETKAQRAIKIQFEENKIEKKQRNKQKKLEEQKRKFELKQEKKREKHRGH